MAENNGNKKPTPTPAIETFHENVKKSDRGSSISSNTTDGRRSGDTVRNTMPAPIKPGNGGNNKGG